MNLFEDIKSVVEFIAYLVGIIAAISGLIKNRKTGNPEPTNPDGDDPIVIAMPKPKEEETQKPVKSKAA